jgi:hypothetical protein
MVRWTLVTLLTVLLAGPADDKQPPASQPAESQPTSRPGGATTLRRPAQADVLKNLIGEQDRPRPVAPVDPGRKEPKEGGTGGATLLEGTQLVERPGRLVHEDGRAKFLFTVDANTPTPRSMSILESQLLETMEREAETGFPEFIISAEVTRYRGNNYLLLRKVLRRTGHGNLAP